MLGGQLCHRLRSCVEINQLRHFLPDAMAFLHRSGQLHKKRDIGQAVLKTVLNLLHQTVISGIISVITEKEDGSIIVDAFFLQCTDDLTRQVIHLAAHA